MRRGLVQIDRPRGLDACIHPRHAPAAAIGDCNLDALAIQYGLPESWHAAAAQMCCESFPRVMEALKDALSA